MIDHQPPTQRTYKFTGFPPHQFSQPASRQAAGRGTGGPLVTEAPGSAGPVAQPASTPVPSSHWEQQSRIRALVAQQLQLSEEEAGRRLQQLQQLLPGLQQQLHTMDPNTVARMAADVTAVAARLLQLRAIFPGADAFKLALREPFLVYGSTIFRLQRAAAELRRMLPGMDIDRLVEDQPSLLDVKTLRKAIKEFQRAEPSLDVHQVLVLDPSMPFRFSFRRSPNLSMAIGRRTVPVPSQAA